MLKTYPYFALILLISVLLGGSIAEAQQNLAQQAYLIFERNCFNCHGPAGSFREQIAMDSADTMVQSGDVVPGKPLESELYTRLVHKDLTKRMPLGQPALSPAAIATIRNWIAQGAPSWDVEPGPVNFITTDAMLTAIQNHLKKLDAFDRPSARYFTMTHLYNAGEGPDTLDAYRVALSKLVNSLSWGFEVINPQPIDAAKTIFYIDLRDYEWDTREAWPQIEAAYPYSIEFNAENHGTLLLKLTYLRGEMDCKVPFVYMDWFLATASLPPLYHDILALPETEQELERELGIDVARNLRSAPGVRVWRAGTNDSGVSNHNRVVERHTSRYGAYWKSHDFDGSAGAKNIFTHPLSFERAGGEVIFNLPNGLQAYYIADADGKRIDVAPTEIVSNPAASDPAVRNGISCIGCHTEGMKTFEDGVRAAINQTTNPSYDKAHALRLYVDQKVMDPLVAEDTDRYGEALQKTGGVFDAIEPVSRFYEAFHGPLEARHAATAIGMERAAFLTKIRNEPSLQNLGLTGLLSGGNVKRDVWTDNFEAVVACLYGDDCPTPVPIPVPIPDPDDDPDTPIFPDGLIPDPNLRAAIAEALGKAPNASIEKKDLARLTQIIADESDIRDLRGLEYAIKLERIELRHNAISDLSPLAGLRHLNNIKLRGNRITDISPLKGLISVDWLGLEENQIRDLSPLKGLRRLNGIGIEDNPVSDVSPLAGLISLEGINARGTTISDFSPLAKLPRLQWIEFGVSPSISKLPSLKGLKTLKRLEIRDTLISDISGLEGLVSLTELNLERNVISDISPLAKLTRLKRLELNGNVISDVSPLAGLTNLERLNLKNNAISDFAPLEALSEKISIQTQGNPGFFLQGGPKITGPWLWVLIPGAQFDTFRTTDLLARASGGDVTEREIATNGATEGKVVGDSVWASHKISSTGGNNINDMLRALGISKGTDGPNLVYGSISLEAPREQQTKMFAGSDDSHKIWLNGQLVNEKHRNWSTDYQQSFPVTLKQGKNVLLIAVHDDIGGWCGHFGFAHDTEYTVLAPGARFSLSTASTHVEKGDTFTLRLNAANITDLAGWQTDITFDPALLKANAVTEGNFLKQGGGRTFFQKGTIQNKQGKITGIRTARTSTGGVNGEGTLLSVRFTAIANGKGRIVLRNFRAGASTGKKILATPPETLIVVEGRVPTFPAWDVNADGVTNITDVQLVTAALGQKPPKNPRTDVNGDGVVDGKDLARVAEHLGEKAAPAAPVVGASSSSRPQAFTHQRVGASSSSRPQAFTHQRVGASSSSRPQAFTHQMVEHALDILRASDDGSLAFRRGIANLEQLLTLFIPEATALLHNYPNPFNPETWIPYQLAAPSEVTVRIYAANGAVVRTLRLGYQPAGIYQYRSRAAYWDGKNEVGESVASGVYFYTLTAGDFTATRKMLIMK